MKKILSNEQIMLFDIHEISPLNGNKGKDFEEDIAKNVINLRQELKHDIPSTTYLTHGIHNVYPAKFIPQVPRFVIKKFNQKGKIILDPFAGSGTTAVESLITGNSNISNDINPLTRFLVEVKTLQFNPRDCFRYIDRLNYHVDSMFKSNFKFTPKWSNLDYWYPPEILMELKKIWGYIHSIDENENNIKYILKTSALYISRKYSYGEDGSPKLFRSKHKTIKIEGLTQKYHELGYKLLQKELLEKAKQYLGAVTQFNSNLKAEFRKVDSLDDTIKNYLMILNVSLEGLDKIIPKQTIDCIITSPPYIYAQEYFRSTKIDMYWLDMIDDDSVRRLTKMEIGQKSRPFLDFSAELSNIKPFNKTLNVIKELSEKFKSKENILRYEAYFNDMMYFVRLSSKLLVNKGILAVFIGEPKVFGTPINVKEIISQMMEECNFRIINTYFDIIKSRHLLRNRLNENPNGISGEWLILGEKL
jgi:DNA modification methylase